MQIEEKRMKKMMERESQMKERDEVNKQIEESQ
jgi:hypothetical protein